MQHYRGKFFDLEAHRGCNSNRLCTLSKKNFFRPKQDVCAFFIKMLKKSYYHAF